MCLVRLNNIGQFVRGDVDSPAIDPNAPFLCQFARAGRQAIRARC